MSIERVSSEESRQAAVASVSKQLRELAEIANELRTARAKLADTQTQLQRDLAAASDELARIKAQHAQLREVVDTEREAISLIAVRREEIQRLIADAEAAASLIPAKIGEMGSELRRETDGGLTRIRADLEGSARTHRDQLSREIADTAARVRTQLDDVLRAYESASTRWNEIEATFTKRIDAVESAVSVQASALEMADRGVIDLRTALTKQTDAARIAEGEMHLALSRVQRNAYLAVGAVLVVVAVALLLGR